jgi:hypothetical protein
VAAAELEQPFLARHAHGAQDGVGVHAHHGRKVAGRREALARADLAVGDRAAYLRGDLVVQGRRIGAVDDIEGGVIEEARDRQRDRRRRLAVVLAGGIAVALALALAHSGGGGSPAGGRSRIPGDPLRPTFTGGRPYVNGLPFQLAVSPSLQAGNVGLCVAAQGHGTSCDGPYTGPGRPVLGVEGFSSEAQVGPRGEIDFTLTGPGVAAVRVEGLGTFRTLPLPACRREIGRPSSTVRPARSAPCCRRARARGS